MDKLDVIIVGAGAAGLEAARELGKAGKKVLILEARDRIGGRIWPLDEKEWGYSAQAGGEFVHGPAPVTQALIKEAGLTYEPMSGERWGFKDGQIDRAPREIPNEDLLNEKLKELQEDMPIGQFLDTYFKEEEYKGLRDYIVGMVGGFDAADSGNISTFSLREEWLGEGEWIQGRIKEGYGPLLEFLRAECQKNGTQILLGQYVASIQLSDDGVLVITKDGTEYQSDKVLITASLPTISAIKFTPEIPEKLAAAAHLGFGDAAKLLLKFKTQWWINATDKDLSKMAFLITRDNFASWWTQYPSQSAVLTGWMAGPTLKKFRDISQDDMVNVGLDTLANIFKVTKEFLEEQLTDAKFINWPVDPLARGAYSYSTVGADESYAELRKPADGKIFFAGEALCLGNESATVEGALASGKEVVEQILNNED